MNDLARRALDIAATQIGVREHGHNRGPEIDGYCRDIGHDPAAADPWCSTFVCAMFKRAADQLGIPVPFHLTAGVFTLEERAPPACKTSQPAPGAIFIKVGHKHTGLVLSVPEGHLRPDSVIQTIEGNTDPGGSSEGDGVYQRSRAMAEIMLYLDLSRLDAEPPAPLVA